MRHHFTPEIKQQSKLWIGRGESCPKKAKPFPAAGKIMATVFCYADAPGIVFNDYLRKGKTIKGEYYAYLLQRLGEKLK